MLSESFQFAAAVWWKGGRSLQSHPPLAALALHLFREGKGLLHSQYISGLVHLQDDRNEPTL